MLNKLKKITKLIGINKRLRNADAKKNYKKSYSQCGEDLIVKFIFDQFNIEHPSYIDIGAHHPFFINNTAIFYNDKSLGINIEPDPTLFKEFIKHRRCDINLNIGVWEERGELDFYIINNPSLNTFSKEEALSYKNEGNYFITEQKKISVLTLMDIVEKYCNGVFPDFLTIDAEGVDESIIKQLDFTNNYPKVICIETITFSNSGKGKKRADLIARLISKGYFIYADTYINTIFVNKVFWGNR